MAGRNYACLQVTCNVTLASKKVWHAGTRHATARRHARKPGMQARRHATRHGTPARKKTRHAGTPARRHATGHGMLARLARLARNLADSTKQYYTNKIKIYIHPCSQRPCFRGYSAPHPNRRAEPPQNIRYRGQ